MSARDRDRDRDAFYVYRCYTDDGVLLYVGQTYALRQRVLEHAMGPWRHVCSYVTYERFETRDSAKSVEWLAIREERPVFNVAERRPAEHLAPHIVFKPHNHHTRHEDFQPIVPKGSAVGAA